MPLGRSDRRLRPRGRRSLSLRLRLAARPGRRRGPRPLRLRSPCRLPAFRTARPRSRPSSPGRPFRATLGGRPPPHSRTRAFRPRPPRTRRRSFRPRPGRSSLPRSRSSRAGRPFRPRPRGPLLAALRARRPCSRRRSFRPRPPRAGRRSFRPRPPAATRGPRRPDRPRIRPKTSRGAPRSEGRPPLASSGPFRPRSTCRPRSRARPGRRRPRRAHIQDRPPRRARPPPARSPGLSAFLRRAARSFPAARSAGSARCAATAVAFAPALLRRAALALVLARPRSRARGSDDLPRPLRALRRLVGGLVLGRALRRLIGLVFGRHVEAPRGVGIRAMASISTPAPFGSAETCTVARAGAAVPTNSPYTRFTAAKSLRSMR